MAVFAAGCLNRFIPAYAGLSSCRILILATYSVHPRIRGVIPIMDNVYLDTFGSSPHTRGYRLPRPGNNLLTRFIPAYAGLSAVTAAASSASTVHPRIRGVIDLLDNAILEQVRFIPAYAGLSPHRDSICHLICGSSPHTRGYLSVPCKLNATPRFIPAYAGLSYLTASWKPCIRGSSPHTRGYRKCGKTGFGV